MVAALVLLVGVCGRREQQASEQREQLQATIRSAAPLIQAIRKYEELRGAPPPSLDALVPEFLDALPQPAGPAEGGWEYWADVPGGRKEGGKWHRVQLEPSAGGWALGIAVRKEFRPRFLYNLGDYFLYHPSGHYPRTAYGGVLERVGEWGYYFE
ncbi:MAG: hypothetical protein AB1725_06920 [Armatimonadota bacterium]